MIVRTRFSSFVFFALFAGSCGLVTHAFADDVADTMSAVEKAKSEAAKAQEDVTKNRPDDANSKQKEDELDAKARSNDDTSGDPKVDKTKQAATEAEDNARAAADKAAQKSKDPEQSKKYRDALEKRRQARKKLKDAAAKLKRILQKRRQSTSDNADIEKAVKDADKALKEVETPIAMVVPPNRNVDLAALVSVGQIEIDSVGTGETIGHIADLKVQNLTDQPITCAIGPMVLESVSRQSQDYVCPKSQTAHIDPHGSATVPVDGVCVNRHKPPVARGAPGDLIVNGGNPNTPQDPSSHIKPRDADKLLRLCSSKYDAADKLLKDGGLKDIPYPDPKKKKDIVVQWSTWSDPQISELTGVPPATKDDLKKVVYKQVEEQGPLTPEKKKKIDQGIDTIFEKVELTTAKAKDLEQPSQYPAPEETGSPPSTNAISDRTGESEQTPTPGTQEKKTETTPATQEKKEEKPASASDKVAEAEKKLDKANEKLKKAQTAFDDTVEKYFGPDTKGHALLQTYEKGIDTAKKDFNNAVGKAQAAYKKAVLAGALIPIGTKSDKAKEALEEYETWKEIAKGRADKVYEAERELEEKVKDWLKQIDAQVDTHVVDDLGEAEGDVASAEKQLDEAEKALDKEKAQKQTAPKETKAAPAKKP